MEMGAVRSLQTCAGQEESPLRCSRVGQHRGRSEGRHGPASLHCPRRKTALAPHYRRPVQKIPSGSFGRSKRCSPPRCCRRWRSVRSRPSPGCPRWCGSSRRAKVRRWSHGTKEAGAPKLNASRTSERFCQARTNWLSSQPKCRR